MTDRLNSRDNHHYELSCGDRIYVTDAVTQFEGVIVAIHAATGAITIHDEFDDGRVIIDMDLAEEWEQIH